MSFLPSIFPSEFKSCLISTEAKRTANNFIGKAVLFLLLASKFLRLRTSGTYDFKGGKSIVSVFSDKVCRYPLFVNKKVNLQSSKLALMFLFADLMKVSRALDFEVGVSPKHFREFGDLVKLIFYILNSDF